MSGAALKPPPQANGIGRRLKLARTASGLSRPGLSAAIGGLATAQDIGRYECNESLPDSDILSALSATLEVSLDYLLGDQDIFLESIDYRKKSITRKRELARIETQILMLFERYLIVEEALGIPCMEWDKPKGYPYPVHQRIEDADIAATGLRDNWGLGLNPIPNLVELLEKSGIKVLSFHLDSVDGLTAMLHIPGKRSAPVIVVNETAHGERQRFTLAHELGHLAMDVSEDLDKEKAAHRFAGAFLMPAEALRREIGKIRSSISYKELLYLKDMFGTSVQAITYRCKDLGIFSKSMCRGLFIEFAQLGWRKPPYEPSSLASEEPKRFKRLVFRALSENAITESLAAELLDISVWHLDKMMESPPPEWLTDSSGEFS